MAELFSYFRSIPDLYSEKILSENVTTKEHLDGIVKNHFDFLNSELAATDSYEPVAYYFQKQWSGIQQASSNITTWDTGIDYNLLRYIGEKSVYFPDDFVIQRMVTHTFPKINLIYCRTFILIC